MSTATERFSDLARKVMPLDAEAAELKMEMVHLAAQISLETVTDAFPAAEVLTLRAVSEIKPTDGGKSAQEAVRLLTENNVRPTHIIHDTARHIVLLCILPRAAKVTPTKATKKKRIRA